MNSNKIINENLINEWYRSIIPVNILHWPSWVNQVIHTHSPKLNVHRVKSKKQKKMYIT
jgi:hypothetical protein